ncbi:MAG: hypothetical protein RLZZ165_1384 [Bacteroidota bacterium]|jgi:uncharacterized BrkB/YihY/UPF0761 family membrane protein
MSEKSWKDHQAVHVILVLLVFSCTGLSVARIGGWLAQWLGLEHFSLAYWLMWIVALLPLYNVLLLGFAFIFGKFRYFRDKQRRMVRRIAGWFRRER